MNDLRSAVRVLTSHKWFSAAVIVTLGVGIGSNATVFTLSSAVLFKPLPFRDGGRIVVLSRSKPAEARWNSPSRIPISWTSAHSRPRSNKSKRSSATVRP